MAIRFCSKTAISATHFKVELVENFHRLDALKHSTAMPKAFTEKGLYMLATILKSKKSIETKLPIETFSKVRLPRSLAFARNDVSDKV